MLHAMIDSIVSNAANKSRLLFKLYIDNDDDESLTYSKTKLLEMKQKEGFDYKIYSEEHNTRPLSDMHNFMFDKTDEILFLCGDDVLVRTPGWDVIVESVFSQVPDKIALIYGRDGIHNSSFAPHYFIHRQWVEALGYVSPAYYTADWSDTWMFEIASIIKRACFIDKLIIEHMHWTQGKSKFDETAALCESRRRQGQNEKLFRSYSHFCERMEDAKKLYRVILNGN